MLEPPVLKLYALSELEHLEVSMQAQGMHSVPFKLKALSNLSKLTCLKFAWKLCDASASRLCSELTACKALKKLEIHAVGVDYSESLYGFSLSAWKKFRSVNELVLDQRLSHQEEQIPLDTFSIQRCEESLQVEKLKFCAITLFYHWAPLSGCIMSAKESLTDLQLSSHKHKYIWAWRSDGRSPQAQIDTTGVEAVLHLLA